jgi:hypothetical protein
MFLINSFSNSFLRRQITEKSNLTCKVWKRWHYSTMNVINIANAFREIIGGWCQLRRHLLILKLSHWWQWLVRTSVSVAIDIILTGTYNHNKLIRSFTEDRKMSVTLKVNIWSLVPGLLDVSQLQGTCSDVYQRHTRNSNINEDKIACRW